MELPSIDLARGCAFRAIEYGQRHPQVTFAGYDSRQSRLFPFFTGVHARMAFVSKKTDHSRVQLSVRRPGN